MSSVSSLPYGIVCTPEEYARSTNGDTSIHCLSRTDGIGLAIITESGLISLVAVTYVFFIILRNVICRSRHTSRQKWRIFHQPMDLLMFSLFFADILQAIGAVMDIKWIMDGKVEVGSFCDAQGIVQNVGETGVAMTTLTIAIFTFVGVWMGKSIHSMWITRAVLACVWLFIAVIVIVGNTIKRAPESRFQLPTPFWCWVSADYMKWRIMGEYLWFWITLVVSFIVYIPLYLWIRGNIVIEDPAWWKVHFQHADRSDPELRKRRRQSLVMPAYPMVYCVNILPLSVVRWISFIQGPNSIAPAATFAVASIYGLSGFCNVLLLLTTKPEAGLFAKMQPSPLLPGPMPLQEQEIDGDYHNLGATESPPPQEEEDQGRLYPRGGALVDEWEQETDGDCHSLEATEGPAPQ